MTDVPGFEEFFVAVNDGQPPLPWQKRLSAEVVERGWPRAIGVPTGLGKTACLDVAVWAMAVDAGRPPADRVHPTRIWYVVNRRLLVDEGADRARRIQHRLETSADPAVAAVREALAQRGGGSLALQVTTLHGGLDGRQLPGSPAQPAVVCSTVPMYGSRLLFRGYGGARFTHSIETALAATDALVLLDEAHLSGPLEHLVAQLRDADAATSAVLGDRRSDPVLVSLTATGDRTQPPFDIDDEDRAHPVVARRLGAAKPTELVTATAGTIVDRLVAAATDGLGRAGQPLGAVIFVNTARRALEVRKQLAISLGRSGIDADLTLLTGRLRPVDATAVRTELLEGDTRLRAGRDRSLLPRHHVVVATQTLEVGADLDFDLLVTETADVRALVQRLGRLNRRGDADHLAGAVIVHATDSPTDPLYGDEPAMAWSRLCAHPTPLDLSPRQVNAVLGDPGDRALRTPELLANHLDEFAKTSTPSIGEAPVNLFFEGIDDDARAQVQVAWRTYLPGPAESSGRLSPLRLSPPLSDAETVELPLWEVRSQLERLEAAGRQAWRLDSDRLGLVPAPSDALRAGDQVVFDCEWGAYSAEHGWDPGMAAEVVDRSDAGGQLLLRRRTVLGAVGRQAPDMPPPLMGVLRAALDAFDGPTAVTVRTLGEAIAHQEVAGGAEVAVAARLATELEELGLGGEGGDRATRDAAELVRTLVAAFGVAVGPKVELGADGDAWVARHPFGRRMQWAMPAADEYDELSSTDVATRLGPHLSEVGRMAAHLGRTIGLPDDLVDAVARAGALHDLGKAEPRFQRWLGASEELLAKSSGLSAGWRSRRIAAGWPPGGRHEALSVRVVHAALAAGIDDLVGSDPDLVLHLVASHHGRGRPSMFGVSDSGTGHFRVEGALLGNGDGDRTVIEVDGDLSVHDWEQPGRFARVNQRYGRRGVALLEAVLRQADWIVSSVDPGDDRG